MRTINQFCAAVGVTRACFEAWRRRGITPRTVKLENGRIGIPEDAWDEWFRRRQIDRLRVNDPTLLRPLDADGRDRPFADAVMLAADAAADARLVQEIRQDLRKSGLSDLQINGVAEIVRLTLEMGEEAFTPEADQQRREALAVVLDEQEVRP